MTTETDDKQNRSKAKPLPPIEYLRELFVVDPTSPSGLRWRVSRGGVCAGSHAGCIRKHSTYPSRSDWVVSVNSRMWMASRIIYCITYGEIPQDMQVDHINGNPLDNRVENLRIATPTQNSWNCKTNKRNKSGIRGVWWRESNQKWRVAIRTLGRRLQIGEYSNLSDARRAREEAELRLHGEFSPLARKEGA